MQTTPQDRRILRLLQITSDSGKDYLSITQVAQRADCDRRTVRRLIARAADTTLNLKIASSGKTTEEKSENMG